MLELLVRLERVRQSLRRKVLPATCADNYFATVVPIAFVLLGMTGFFGYMRYRHHLHCFHDTDPGGTYFTIGHTQAGGPP